MNTVTKTLGKPANAQPGNPGVPSGTLKPAPVGTVRENGPDMPATTSSPGDSAYSSTAGSK